MKFRGIQVNYN